jgi:hypothetical protein
MIMVVYTIILNTLNINKKYLNGSDDGSLSAYTKMKRAKIKGIKRFTLCCFILLFRKENYLKL